MNKKYLILAIIGASAVILLLASILIKQSVDFHATKISPNKTSELIQPVVVTFNRPLAPADKQEFSITPSVPGNLQVEGSKLIFKLYDAYTKDETYTVTVTKPISSSGDIGPNITFKFQAKFPDFNKLTKEQKEKYSQTDALETKYPVVQFIPYDNNDFSIDYTLDDFGTPRITIQLFGIITGPHTDSENLTRLQQQKAAALQYLKEHQAPVGKYEITITPNPISGTDSSYTIPASE